MSLLVRPEIPEKYRERFKKRITYIALGRCGWIIPSVMCVFIIFMILVGATTMWGNDNTRIIILDVITLLNLGFIYFLYKKHRVENADEVGKNQYIIQNATAGSVIIYGAMITAFDTNSSFGYSTFIVCLLFVGGLLYIKSGTIILMSLSGLAMIHVTRMITGMSFVTNKVLQEVILLGFVMILALIENRFNVNTMIKTFLLEQELEDRVEERTRQLSEETLRAQKSDMLKTAFLANMSHEIRTPLNGILGFASLLKDEKLKPDQRKKYIDTVINSGNTLLEILNDIIEVSRIESGVCDVNPEEFSFNDILREVLDSFGGNEKVSSGTVKLINQDEKADPLILISDRLKLVQILINLVNNAVKYTDSGIIAVGFSTAGANEIEIFVKDTGRGIRGNDFRMIFERFQQSELDPYKRGEGVGLGLTIVRGYTDLLKGTISVESESGKGSTFRLRIPVRYHAE